MRFWVQDCKTRFFFEKCHEGKGSVKIYSSLCARMILDTQYQAKTTWPIEIIWPTKCLTSFKYKQFNYFYENFDLLIRWNISCILSQYYWRYFPWLVNHQKFFKHILINTKWLYSVILSILKTVFRFPSSVRTWSPELLCGS